MRDIGPRNESEILRCRSNSFATMHLVKSIASSAAAMLDPTDLVLRHGAGSMEGSPILLSCVPRERSKQSVRIIEVLSPRRTYK